MKPLYLIAFITAVSSTLVHGHPGHEAFDGSHAAGFGHGFLHPLTGLDHVLAMLAVGLWAAQMGGRCLVAIPAAFVGALLLGALIGMSGLALPLIEPGILASVIILGLLIATATRLPLAVSMAIVAVFAICHGYAHAVEMPVSASGFAYGCGFLLATVLLNAAGLGIGLAISRVSGTKRIRWAGFGILAGALLIITT